MTQQEILDKMRAICSTSGQSYIEDNNVYLVIDAQVPIDRLDEFTQLLLQLAQVDR